MKLLPLHRSIPADWAERSDLAETSVVIRDWLPVVALIAMIKTLLTEERVQSRREEIANGISSGIGLHLSSGVLDGQSLRQVSTVQLLKATRLRHRDCLRNVLLKLKAWHLVETWTNVSYQMPTLTRVEFSTSRSLRSSRVVLLIEFPDEALERIRKEKASLEVEASHIAWQAIGAFKLGILRGDLNLISRTLSNERITPR